MKTSFSLGYPSNNPFSVRRPSPNLGFGSWETIIADAQAHTNALVSAQEAARKAAAEARSNEAKAAAEKAVAAAEEANVARNEFVYLEKHGEHAAAVPVRERFAEAIKRVYIFVAEAIAADKLPAATQSSTPLPSSTPSTSAFSEATKGISTGTYIAVGGLVVAGIAAYFLLR